MRSEWTKLWTLRSTRWSLLISFVAMAGLGPLVAALQMSRWSHLEPHDRLTYDAINTGVGGYHFAQLTIGVLGVLVISGEYSTGHDPLEHDGGAPAAAGPVGQARRLRGGHVRD